VRLVTYRDNGIRNAVGRAGVLTDEGVIDINGANSGLPGDLLRFIQGGEDYLDRLRASLEGNEDTLARHGHVAGADPAPPKIVCIGVNYADQRG